MAPPSASSTETGLSLLDTDLYKLTMQAAVLAAFPDVHVQYGYTNRTKDMLFTRKGWQWVRERVEGKSISFLWTGIVGLLCALGFQEGRRILWADVCFLMEGFWVMF